MEAQLCHLLLLPEPMNPPKTCLLTNCLFTNCHLAAGAGASAALVGLSLWRERERVRCCHGLSRFACNPIKGLEQQQSGRWLRHQGEALWKCPRMGEAVGLNWQQ